MIATVTLNPCLDKVVAVDGLIVDEANRWTSLDRYPGGKGIDVSRSIHELGGTTTAYGFIGGFYGMLVQRLLDKEGVPFSFTQIEQETRTNFIITDTRTYRQTRINAPGPHISKTELERLRRKIRNVPNPDFLVFSGSVPPGVPDDIYKQLIQKAKERNVKTVLDADGQWLREGIKAKPYLIKPNIHETEQLLDTELATEDAIIRAASKLIEDGIEIVVISRGKNGLIAANKGSILKVISPQVEVLSTVGAGDSTVAGLLLKLAEGKPLSEACRYAAAAGTAAVLTSGTELCHRGDVERLFPQVKVEEIS
jgi:6-phosphofructokinase 2